MALYIQHRLFFTFKKRNNRLCNHSTLSICRRICEYRERQFLSPERKIRGIRLFIRCDYEARATMFDLMRPMLMIKMFRTKQVALAAMSISWFVFKGGSTRARVPGDVCHLELDATRSSK